MAPQAGLHSSKSELCNAGRNAEGGRVDCDFPGGALMSDGNLVHPLKTVDFTQNAVFKSEGTFYKRPR